MITLFSGAVGFAEMLGRIHPALQWLYQMATEHAYASFAMLTFLDGSGLPVPAEVSILALARLVQRGDVQLWPAILIGAGANTAGCLIPYSVARWGGAKVIDRWLPKAPERRARIEAMAASYGVLAIILIITYRSYRRRASARKAEGPREAVSRGP
ncbi:MAG: hypothetical protein WD535_02870 [Thermaerobacterales bacterium]